MNEAQKLAVKEKKHGYEGVLKQYENKLHKIKEDTNHFEKKIKETQALIDELEE